MSRERLEEKENDWEEGRPPFWEGGRAKAEFFPGEIGQGDWEVVGRRGPVEDAAEEETVGVMEEMQKEEEEVKEVEEEEEGCLIRFEYFSRDFTSEKAGNPSG